MKRLTHTFFIVSFFTLIVFKTAQGQSWLPLDKGVRKTFTWEQPIINCVGFDAFHGYLYVGGDFDSAGSYLCRKMAIWDGLDWINLEDSLGGHMVDDIDAMINWGDTVLYAANGIIGAAYGIDVNVVDIDDLNDKVNCFYIFHDTIYAGGYFTNGIKKWNGAQWKTVGGGVSGVSANVKAIGEYNGELIIGGFFEYAGDSLVKALARWDGTTWHPMKGGVKLTDYEYSGFVHALAEYNGQLIVGGDFDTIGTDPISNLASWDGTNWNNPFGEINSFPECMFVDSTGLYIGGLGEIDGVDMNWITRWDGSSFHPLGDGFNQQVFSITRFQGNLYAAGNFRESGNGDTLNCIAMYDIGTSAQNSHSIPNSLAIFPNPTSTTIILSLPSNQNAILSIFNLLGEKVKEEKVTGREVTMDVSSLPQGLYLVRTENGVVGKFVKE